MTTVTRCHTAMSVPKPRTQHWTPNPDPTSITVPGLDATASINDQIDQIDQLITIRLQNIDANFSRIQHLIATKLLPAFKRYAEGTEPVREAAKFWKSFYEAAAQVRIPIASDTSSFYPAEDSGEDSVVDEQSQESIATPTNDNRPEDSFVRGAPISSTPLTRDPASVKLPGDNEEDDSWAASIESPFERLVRQVRDLTHEETREVQGDPSTSSAPSFSPMHGSYTGAFSGHRATQSVHHQKPGSQAGRMIPSTSRKGKSPLRQNVLRQNAALASASDTTTSTPAGQTLRRFRTPRNPFLPSSTSSRQWNGLVDLRQPSPAKSRGLRTPGPSNTKRNAANNGYDSDSSDDLFPEGLSPPVTMQFAMATRPRASPVKLMPTPARVAAERIGRDLVDSAVGRRIGSAKRLHSPIKTTENEPSIGSESDSDSSEHDESNPSAGFLFATQNNARAQADDSFASSQQSLSSDEDEDEAVRAARHPLAHIFVAGTQGGVEDSFDQDESFAPAEEETVFGARLIGQGGEAKPRLTLMRDALIDDTHPGAVSLNPHAQRKHNMTVIATRAGERAAAEQGRACATASQATLASDSAPSQNIHNHAASLLEPVRRHIFHGQGTWYIPGLGACGSYNTRADYVVAINQAQYHSKMCHKHVRIINMKNGKSVHAEVQGTHDYTTYNYDCLP
ncbi:hypothetical protein JB92DRAFT_2835106 [Gautieria morchelliformis]|nr:hypothetical protein JB92DRAFT_2835106 [Gautieria morchelliformis]